MFLNVGGGFGSVTIGTYLNALDAVRGFSAATYSAPGGDFLANHLSAASTSLISDDYIDEAFLQYVERTIPDFDMIGFKDIYFQHDGSLHYWSGYTNNRQGEPCGAGKVYSRKFLECINWNLFDVARDRGLDKISWQRVKQANAKIHVTSLKQNGLLLVDIKDGEGMTPFNKFKGLEQITNRSGIPNK
jgi:hypothetical protein